MGHREELLRRFHLGPEDLEANQRGLLSQRQARYLIQSGVRNLLGSLLISLALAAILYAVAGKPLAPIQWILAAASAAAAVIVGSIDYHRTRLAALDPAGGIGPSFQAEEWYQPPLWPEEPGAQTKMLHFDIEVDDLEAAVAYVVALGGTVAAHQPPGPGARPAGDVGPGWSSLLLVQGMRPQEDTSAIQGSCARERLPPNKVMEPTVPGD
jgi:hypothetical protein